MLHRTRLLLALRSGLYGWCAGLLASMPAELLVGWRDSQGDWRLFFAQTTAGLVAWSLWTLMLGAASWLIFAVPCVLLIPPKWLVRHRWWVLVITVVLSVRIVFMNLDPFQNFRRSRIPAHFALYMPYTSFASFFGIVTAWWYLHLVRKQLGD